MRLWSLHPKYLDAKGLVALWREGLLAQKVLAGKTRGYTRHPQLERFKAASNPAGAIASYLHMVACEADARGYRFDASKIATGRLQRTIAVTRGQVEYEYQHLVRKLHVRDADRYAALQSVGIVEVHPLFTIVDGAIESWEIVVA